MKTILCPTDLTQVSQNALLYAIEFAKRSCASLILFHTEFIPADVSRSFDTSFINIPSEHIKELRERLESLMVQIKFTCPQVRCHYVIEEGLVAENIADYANKHGVDLIIMGTTGVSGWEALVSGSNAANVMDKAKCPVLIVPEKVDYKEPKNFVYALDLMDNEDEIVTQVIQISKLFSANLELIHVLGQNTVELVDTESSLGAILNNQDHSNVSYKIIRGRDSLEDIENYAKNKADILVMAHRKKGFLEKLFSKNRAVQVAYHAEVPLLVMHKA